MWCQELQWTWERSSLGGKFATSLGREVNLMIETWVHPFQVPRRSVAKGSMTWWFQEGRDSWVEPWRMRQLNRERASRQEVGKKRWRAWKAQWYRNNQGCCDSMWLWQVRGSSARCQHLPKALETNETAKEGSGGPKLSSGFFYAGPAFRGLYQDSALCPEALGGCQVGLIISPL